MPERYLERELEELIRTDPAIWRFIREGSLDGVWYWDLENPDNEYMSPEFWRNFGYDPATKKHLAKEWFDIIHPDDLEIAQKNAAAHIADPKHPYDQVVRYTCADGSTAWVRCRGLAVRDESGKAIRFIGAHTDVTAEHRQIQASRDEAETILNAATSGIIAFDPDGRVARCNSRARHMLGGLTDPVPFDWPEAIHFLDAETMHPLDDSADPIRRAMSGNRLNTETHLMRRSRTDADPRYVRVSSAAVPNDEAGIHMVLIVDDVSLEERNRQVVERKGRLDALGQLTGGIAHDFNNLLTSLLYSIVLAGRTEDPEKRTESLREAEASVELARALTTRLMSFARKQPGMAEARPVERVFDDFQRFARPMLEENLEFITEIAKPGLSVYCDPVQLETALLNLVLNSRDAILRAGRGHRILLRARAVDVPAERTDTNAPDGSAFRFVELSVSDNGPGMDPETRARATDPFFTTKGTNSGTGLGLSMVYGFARHSNGDLRIYSELGTGTTVQLVLPRGSAVGLDNRPQPDSEIVLGTGQTILLVEDEPQILRAAAKLLNEIGYGVITATSGREALNLAEAGAEFDLLLTDVVMPGKIGGFELAASMRGMRPEVPVVYMSGYVGFTPSEMGAVAAPLLQKPAPAGELSRTLADALKEKS